MREGWRFHHLQAIIVAISNLFDKSYIASCIGTAYCIYGQGWLALANLKYRW